ncbi:MAG: DUF167 domain-containing protein [Thermodesulfobacteriota bacterium]|nr:DUF167 domain-containing protein [Thermodesulfobacteriota bacterium]
MPYLQTLPNGNLLLSLYVQPRASRNELAGLHGDALKLRLTTPPVDGRANKAVISFLAKLFKIPKSAIIIRSGLQSRSKMVLLSGLDEQKVRSLVL